MKRFLSDLFTLAVFFGVLSHKTRQTRVVELLLRDDDSSERHAGWMKMLVNPIGGAGWTMALAMRLPVVPSTCHVASY